jgi:hypothetical protein
MVIFPSQTGHVLSLSDKVKFLDLLKGGDVFREDGLHRGKNESNIHSI